ncbi:MAG: WG repeat-containing protein [Saprospiraceae bacterium]|nr:WG repeat-containing protein [Saprospiraceae bacterium]
MNFKGRWGVVTTDGQPIIPFEYDYIAPLRNKVCIVKKDGLYGVANILGKEVVESKFNRIVLENNQAKAYTHKPDKPGEEILTLFSFDDQGLVKDNSSSDKHFQITIGVKKYS